MESTKPYLDHLAFVIKSAREAGLRIIYVSTVFRRGYLAGSPRNRSIAKILSSGTLIEGDESAKIHPAVTPVDGDVLITKCRGSAFHGSDLDIVLHSLDIEGLVMTGLSSSGVVLSTVRQAADLDYQLTILEDLCMDRDPEIHEMLVKKIFSKQAQIQSSARWVAELAKPQILSTDSSKRFYPD